MGIYLGFLAIQARFRVNVGNKYYYRPIVTDFRTFQKHDGHLSQNQVNFESRKHYNEIFQNDGNMMNYVQISTNDGYRTVQRFAHRVDHLEKW